MKRHPSFTSQPVPWTGFLLCIALLAAVGCSSDRTCTADSDCFQGEGCFGGFCEVASDNEPINVINNTPTTNNETNNEASNLANNSNNVSNGTNNATNSNNTNSSTNNATNNATNNQTNNPTCLVDPFGNMCTDDEWEENDGYDPATSNWDETPWASNSWCAGDMLAESSRSLSGTLCAGDRGDAFRFVVANNGPMCLTGDRVTFRMLVEIETPCAPDLFRVEPYTFGRDPIRNDLCADDPDVRCTVSNGGQNHLIEWIWDGQQIFDPRIQIMAEDPTLQFDYNITFEINDQ